jgi:hypothetical protein
MTLVRVYLLAVGVFSVVVGLGYMVRPVELAALADLVLPSPVAVIEVQGFYGGQLFGMGLGIILGLLNRRFVVPALFLVAVPLAGTAVGRLYGAIAAGSCPPMIAGLFALEAATAIVGGILLRRELAPAA